MGLTLSSLYLGSQRPLGGGTPPSTDPLTIEDGSTPLTLEDGTTELTLEG